MSPGIVGLIIIILLLGALAVRAAVRKPGRPRRHDPRSTDAAHFGLTAADEAHRHHHHHPHHHHHHGHHAGDNGHHGHGHSDSGGDSGGGGGEGD